MSAWADLRRAFSRLLSQPSAEALAERELAAARRNLLENERMRDYHENMVAFNRKRIESLQAFFSNKQ